VLSAHNLSAKALPQGTLCLTFDDGPGVTVGDGRGPKTDRLADYLADEGIRATFFVCGKYVDALPHVVRRAHEQGHLIANHTTHHPNLIDELAAGRDIVAELTGTDRAIREATGTIPRFFRAPYGRWSAAVAATLNADPVAEQYVGPVHWDANAEDWACWRDGMPAEVCAGNYLSAIETAGRGIVLMHDCTADQDDWRRNNATYEVIRILVPQLKALGYRFVGLDEAPLSFGA
jgi:peptidoglycan/xylan/chitin deacetylase (PgdA/CDA1 family)